PDGSEAEMCGNGIRCLAKYAIERDIARPGPSGLTVETLAGVLTLLPSGADGRMDRVKASMGIPRFHPQEIPVALREGVPFDTIQPQGAVVNYPLEVDGVSLRLAFLSMGNPHAVAFLREPVDSFPLEAVGPQVERHSLFPRRVNFEVAHLQGRGAIQARVWERGAGLTLACGSGACAIAVAARLQGLVDDQVDITLPGGTLTVQWDGQGEVWMEGPVEEVFTGEWEGA
ncbi:MAG: diaminopimelate epimerase, partial [Dehalococcoidia bacterium]